jgi:beta-glucanase (GH16 family)
MPPRAPSPRPTSVPGPSLPPVPNAGSWHLNFSDDFSGTSLDLKKWHPNWFGASETAITNSVDTHDQECIDPKQTTVSNGELNIAAIAKSCDGYSFASGLISSNGLFSFTYGYFEARIWTPGGSSISDWPAFWADGQNWPQDGEIDVMEGLGGSACWHFHYSDGDPGGCAAVHDPGSSWHTYGADWEPGSVVYYYDGIRVGQITTGVTSSPMYLILNLGVSSSMSPPIVVPAIMRVDYVRVWSH